MSASLVNNFGSLFFQNQLSVYLAIYFSTIILGNITAFAGIWLAFEGAFGRLGIPFIIITLLAADITGDLLWYFLGRTLRDTRFGNFVKNHLPRHEKIEAHLQRNSERWIFLSKFIYASTFTIIFSVGWAKIDFKKFFRTSILAIISWLPILVGITYGLASGLAPLGGVAIFKKFEYLLALGIVVFIIIDYLTAQALGNFLKKFLKKEEPENGDKASEAGS